ncbi:MAG: hypothetical protein K6T31_10450, partial [Alicyclobacillus sp.]|nr:hypothetical protein [Alicyclobacillus sp.]
MHKKALKGLAAVSTAALPLLSITAAWADTDVSSSFDSRYQANVAQEASLLQTAQSYNINTPAITALSTTVQSLNNEITTLYSAEQSLAALDANLPQPEVPDLDQQLQQLQQKRLQLLHQSEIAWAEVNKWFYQKHTAHVLDMLAKARNKWAQIGVQVKAVNDAIADLKDQQEAWEHNQSVDQGLKNLQNTILNLQAAVIQYTKEWIALAQLNSSGSTGTSTGTLASPILSLSVNNSLTVSNLTPGATVNLYNASGTLVATAVANSYGQAT